MTFTSWQFGVFVALVFAARPRGRLLAPRFPIEVSRGELRWADGVHLDQRSAVIASQAMQRALALARK